MNCSFIFIYAIKVIMLKIVFFIRGLSILSFQTNQVWVDFMTMTTRAFQRWVSDWTLCQNYMLRKEFLYHQNWWNSLDVSFYSIVLVYFFVLMALVFDEIIYIVYIWRRVIFPDSVIWSLKLKSILILA